MYGQWTHIISGYLRIPNLREDTCQMANTEEMLFKAEEAQKRYIEGRSNKKRNVDF